MEHDDDTVETASFDHWRDQYEIDELLTRRDLTFEVLA